MDHRRRTDDWHQQIQTRHRRRHRQAACRGPAPRRAGGDTAPAPPDGPCAASPPRRTARAPIAQPLTSSASTSPTPGSGSSASSSATAFSSSTRARQREAIPELHRQRRRVGRRQIGVEAAVHRAGDSLDIQGRDQQHRRQEQPQRRHHHPDRADDSRPARPASARRPAGHGCPRCWRPAAAGRRPAPAPRCAPARRSRPGRPTGRRRAAGAS